VQRRAITPEGDKMSTWKKLFLGWAIVSAVWVGYWAWDIFYRSAPCAALASRVCAHDTLRCEDLRQFYCRTALGVFEGMSLVPPIVLLLVGGLPAAGIAFSRRNSR
jgi:hypothetical protein